MKKLILIPIFLLLLSACLPCPAANCTPQVDAAYHQGFTDASLGCPPCPDNNCSRAYDSGYSKGREEALNAFTVDLVPDSIYKEIYNKGFQDGQICQGDLVINFPTTQEILNFVALDDTDKIPPDPDNFVCADYTHQLSEKAWAQDIPCYTVMIVLEYVNGYAMFHECVAFPVRDSPDLLFIEPQNDLVIEDVEVGKIPYVCVDNNGNGFCKFLVEKPVLKVLVFR